MNAPNDLLPRAQRRPAPASMLDALRARFGERVSTAAAVREQHGRGESVYDAAPPEAVVFCESTVSTAPAEQVARETDVAYGGVLYVDSLSEPDGPVPTYLDLLRVTTETVAAGLTAAVN